MLRYVVLRLSLPVLGRLRRWAYPSAALVAPGALWHGRTRSRLRRNFAPLCGGDMRRASTASARALANVAQYYVDLGSFRYRDFARLERDHLTIEHLERSAVLDRPGPRLIVAAHTAGTELALRALLPRGYAFTGLVEPVSNPRLSRFLLDWRRAAGGQFFEADLGGVRQCLAALRAGGLVTLVADRDIQGTGVCVEFFGRRVRFPRGPWDLAARTGAPVLPLLCARVRADHIRVVIGEPISVEGGRDREAAVAAAAQQWAGVLERFLAADPGQWMVMEDFWKVHGCGQG